MLFSWTKILYFNFIKYLDIRAKGISNLIHIIIRQVDNHLEINRSLYNDNEIKYLLKLANKIVAIIRNLYTTCSVLSFLSWFQSTVNIIFIINNKEIKFQFFDSEITSSSSWEPWLWC